jgi:hypothetical protein
MFGGIFAKKKLFKNQVRTTSSDKEGINQSESSKNTADRVANLPEASMRACPIEEPDSKVSL